MHPKNCLGVRQFAEAMMCTALYDAANGFLQRHFVEAALSEEFLALRAEEVLELMGCDELNVKAEEQVRHRHRRRSLTATLTAPPYPCRCLRRRWLGSTMTGTGGRLCCRSCWPRSGFLSASRASCPTGSSRMS